MYPEQQKIIVGPFSYRSLKEFWSFIYFHAKAEDYCNAYQMKQTDVQWEAPDLVRANINLDHIIDGRHLRVEFVDGTDMVATIWSHQAERRWTKERGFYTHAYRHGLIYLYDDEKAHDYALKCYEKRSTNI